VVGGARCSAANTRTPEACGRSSREAFSLPAVYFRAHRLIGSSSPMRSVFVALFVSLLGLAGSQYLVRTACAQFGTRSTCAAHDGARQPAPHRPSR